MASGLIQGKVYFYDLIDFDQLKYKTQMDCRNRGGKYKRGTKVTGICYRQQHPLCQVDSRIDPSSSAARKWRRNSARSGMSSNNQTQLLVSTNDSRLRLCRIDDYSLICKYKGLRNKSMQIKASFSGDGNKVISGSETGTIYIWNTAPKKKSSLRALLTGRSNRNDGYESFDSTSSSEIATTVALFAPIESVMIHLHNNNHVLPITEKDLQEPTDKELGKGGQDMEESNNHSRNISKDNGEPSVSNSCNLDDLECDARCCRDYSTRIVISADYEGLLRVFVRLS